jgi:hypothetical protein
MIPVNWSSFGRAGGRLRRYPGGTENASILATVRGSIPNCRAASLRLKHFAGGLYALAGFAALAAIVAAVGVRETPAKSSTVEPLVAAVG